MNNIGKYNFDHKFDFIIFSTSLMFIQTETELINILKNIYKLLNKGGYIYVNETVRKKHFCDTLKDKGFNGYNPKELEKYFINAGFKKVGKEIFLYKTFFGKTVGYLSEKIGYDLTYLLDKILPGKYGNFITLYTK